MTAVPEEYEPSETEVASLLAGEIAERYLDEDENTELVKDQFLTEYAKKVNAGEVWAKPRAQLAAERAWISASKKGGRLAERTIIDLARQLAGEPVLPIQVDMLPMMVTVGTGRRVSLRTITARDIDIMLEIRRQKLDESINAFDQFDAAVDLVRPIVARYGQLGDALKGGAFG